MVYSQPYSTLFGLQKHLFVYSSLALLIKIRSEKVRKELNIEQRGKQVTSIDVDPEY